MLPSVILKGVQTNSGLCFAPSSMVRRVMAGGWMHRTSIASSKIYRKAQLYSAYRGKATFLTLIASITAVLP